MDEAYLTNEMTFDATTAMAAPTTPRPHRKMKT